MKIKKTDPGYCEVATWEENADTLATKKAKEVFKVALQRLPAYMKRNLLKHTLAGKVTLCGSKFGLFADEQGHV